MNDQAGIEQAFLDYRTHGLRGMAVAHRRSRAAARRGRFARHADGRLEQRDELSLRAIQASR